MTKLPAPLALKKYIIEYAKNNNFSYEYSGELNTEQEIDAAMCDMNQKIGCDAQQDIMEGDWKTDLPVESKMWSRHCEVEMVAVKDNHGNYIGFPRYFDGGKHFNDYDWYDVSLEFAEYLNCGEKEVLTTQRTWSKV